MGWLSDRWNDITSAASWVAGKTTEAAIAVKDTVVRSAQAVGHAAVSAYEGTKEFITGTVPETIGNAYGEVRKFATETVPQAIGTAYSNAETFITETVPEAIGNAFDRAEEFVTETVPETISNAYNNIEEWVGEKADAAGSALMDRILDFIYNIPVLGSIIKFIVDAVSGVRDWLDAGDETSAERPAAEDATGQQAPDAQPPSPAMTSGSAVQTSLSARNNDLVMPSSAEDRLIARRGELQNAFAGNPKNGITVNIAGHRPATLPSYSLGDSGALGGTFAAVHNNSPEIVNNSPEIAPLATGMTPDRRVNPAPAPATPVYLS